MQNKININIAVDTVEALSKETLINHIYVMDNSVGNSKGQGTAYLETACWPGQIIHWVATPIDLQTPVCIRRISFLQEKNNQDASIEMSAAVETQQTDQVPTATLQTALTQEAASETAEAATLVTDTAEMVPLTHPEEEVSSSIAMNELDLLTWSGIVPYYMAPGVHYKYQLELQIGNGQYSVMQIDTLSLVWQP